MEEAEDFTSIDRSGDVSDTSSSNDSEGLISDTEAAFAALADTNLETFRHILQRLTKDASDEDFLEALKGVERCFGRLNSQNISILKHAFTICVKWESFDLQALDPSVFREKMNLAVKSLSLTEDAWSTQHVVEVFATLLLHLQKKRASNDAATAESRRSVDEGSLDVAQLQGANAREFLPKRNQERNWSESWKLAVKGVLQKQRRERIRDKALQNIQAYTRRLVPKSEATKEHLRKILSGSFLFGDLDPILREEIVDAFEDVRVESGQKIIKQGDPADNFYVIDVGEFDVLVRKGREPPVLVNTKGPGEYFGELALMYDNLRNATVKATSNALVWAVDRTTFKSIMSRHLAGSPIAQVLREAPVLKKLATRDLIMLSSQAGVETFKRGQHILRAGTTLDKVYIIQEGQVRITWGTSAEGKSNLFRNARGETVAVMKRLEVLGEALILNEETMILWNYVATSDHTSVIVLDRSLFSESLLNDIRKDLQIQLVALGLQRLPAFFELSSGQLYSLADGFEETVYSAGDEITKSGEVLGPEARMYVVQSGTVCLTKSGDDEMIMTPRGSHVSYTSKREPRDSGIGYWGSRLGSFLKSGSNPHSPRGGSFISNLTTQDLLSLSQNLGSARSRKGGSPRQSIGSSTCPWSLSTYGVFGDECLLSRTSTKDESYWPPYKTSSVVDSASAVCLSVTVTKLTSILGPIQELLTRLTNTSILRKIQCLEYLTCSEIDMVSHAMGVKKLHSGELLYRAGDPADRLYIVSKGTMIETVQVPSADGSKQRGDQLILHKGSYFGEHALLDNEPRPSTMVAGPMDANGRGGAELFYLDRGVVEANLGPLQELIENRKRENELKGIVKTIGFEDLEELGVIGTGLFGKVKLVFCRRTREYYALKCVSKAKVVRLQEEDHLRNEKLFMTEMDHPFITRLVRTYKDHKNIYLLQELTTGGELFFHMEKCGPLKECEAAFYAGAVLLALEYMHGKGIVYRDLKPENTLIGDNGYPKLIDMGFAKRIYNRRTYSMCGTPDYMAPEIIRRQGHGKAVDFWALGCLIFELITNTSAFNRGDDPPQLVFQRIIDGRVKFPPHVSSDAMDIIRKLLDPNPESRLGCRKRGPADIKEHPFFTKTINFQLLLRQKEVPPMIPLKLDDYHSLCIPDEPSDPLDEFVVDPSTTKWDDIF